MSLLQSIQSPSDLKALSREQLPLLASEVRSRLIEVTSRNGGHIGPNLGVVELTIALHRAFESPTDRLIFDVSHQGYVHKLFTGRNNDGFDRIRQTNGLSGFLNRSESEHDHYGAGHAGTALSAALGMATARDLVGRREHVVAICGDAAFTCGITLEALNNVATSARRLIVILNDNEWSIDKNVGALSRYFNELITNPVYNRLNNDIEALLNRLPGGNTLVRLGSKVKRDTKDALFQSSIFEKLGLRYIGPIDGHNLDCLEHYLEFAKEQTEPVLIHVLTEKGRGYPVAIDQPEKFHGTSPFEIETGASLASPGPKLEPFQDVLGKALLRAAEADQKVVGITAAMPSGTGLRHLRDKLPSQYFDVGIAEEHAVLFAAGLATSGFRPVCAIYSTFLQRAYDPIIHDICLQNLPVVFCMDRAGLSPNDGATHHGLFDIAYLRPIPGAVIMQPRHEDELADMLHTALAQQGPVFIRYPRGSGSGTPIKEQPNLIGIGEAEVLRDGEDIVIWALGPMVETALSVANQLATGPGIAATVVNARFAKPIDRDLALCHARSHRVFVTLEDHVVTGGFGTAILETLADASSKTPILRIGWPDQFVDHGSSVDDLRTPHGLSEEAIFERIQAFYDENFAPKASPTGRAGLTRLTNT
ncbi:MAG: 1-deoxy-D-xylulose-5-phosphate synthase [Puniceicoccaceae bacterium]